MNNAIEKQDGGKQGNTVVWDTALRCRSALRADPEFDVLTPPSCFFQTYFLASLPI